MWTCILTRILAGSLMEWLEQRNSCESASFCACPCMSKKECLTQTQTQTQTQNQTQTRTQNQTQTRTCACSHCHRVLMGHFFFCFSQCICVCVCMFVHGWMHVKERVIITVASHAVHVHLSICSDLHPYTNIHAFFDMHTCRSAARACVYKKRRMYTLILYLKPRK